MWNISRKRAAVCILTSFELAFNPGSCAIYLLLRYATSRFYQIPESQSWNRLYCDSHIGVKSFMKSKLKIWCFITCTIRIVPGCWAWSQLLGPGTILMMLHIHGTFMIFFSQSFCDTIFIRLKNLMRFLKGFGQVVRFLAGIQTGYKFVRITGFHTKSCKTHSFRFQLLDMRRTSCSIL